MAPSHIARLEAGDRLNPRFETIARIAAELGASLDELAAAAGYLKPSSETINRAEAVRAAGALQALSRTLSEGQETAEEALTVLERLAGIARGRRS